MFIKLASLLEAGGTSHKGAVDDVWTVRYICCARERRPRPVGPDGGLAAVRGYGAYELAAHALLFLAEGGA